MENGKVLFCCIFNIHSIVPAAVFALVMDIITVDRPILRHPVAAAYPLLDVVINASVEIESLTGVLCVIPFELIIITEFDEIPEAISPLTERFGIK